VSDPGERVEAALGDELSGAVDARLEVADPGALTVLIDQAAASQLGAGS